MIGEDEFLLLDVDLALTVSNIPPYEDVNKENFLPSLNEIHYKLSQLVIEEEVRIFIDIFLIHAVFLYNANPLQVFPDFLNTVQKDDISEGSRTKLMCWISSLNTTFKVRLSFFVIKKDMLAYLFLFRQV